ncbi:MAG: hypothetical protein ACXWPM_06400 [Bdellovibrionota bacterium]
MLAHCRIILITGFVLLPLAAYAETGVVEMAEPPAPTEIAVPAPDTNSVPSGSVEAKLSPELPAGSSVNRPWNLNIPGSPTAFTLDQKQWEFGVEMLPYQQLAGMGSTYLFANYGIFNSLTVGLEFAPIPPLYLAIHPKWNFANTDTWSFAVSPIVGFQLMKTAYMTNPSPNIPLAFELTASKVFEDHHRIHLSLIGSRTQTSSTTDGYVYTNLDGSTSSYSGGSQQELGYGLRFSTTYEWRINQSHGMTFWLAPQAKYTHGSSSISDTTYFDNNYKYLTLAVSGGVGYQYNRQNLGLFVGVGAGPSYSKSYYDDSFPYDSLSVMVDFHASISYRL